MEIRQYHSDRNGQVGFKNTKQHYDTRKPQAKTATLARISAYDGESYENIHTEEEARYARPTGSTDGEQLLSAKTRTKQNIPEQKESRSRAHVPPDY